MADAGADAQRSRAASWPPLVRGLLIAAAVLLVAAAAAFSVLDEDCTKGKTGETTTAPAAVPSARAGTGAQAPGHGAGSPSPAPSVVVTTKSTETSTCARPGLTAVPVVALLLLAGLAVSPWLTKVTVGPVTAELAPHNPVDALAQEQGTTAGGVLDPVAVGRARAAEGFLQGAALPGAWSRARLLFLLAPPDPALFAQKAAAGDQDDAALEDELRRVADVVVAASEAPGQVVERAESGRTDLAYAAVNAGKRVVAVLVASLPDQAQPGGGASADAAVSGALLAAGRGWSRVVVDLLLLDDDTP